jgi:AcrR family transcriptional regulator
MLMHDDTLSISTREKIFHAAVSLFSENGYKEVSMRNISKAVGINVSSLYNHFGSKEDILNSLYDYYSANWIKAYPDINKLLLLSETIPPHEVFQMLNFHYDQSITGTMTSILKIAVRQMNIDPSSMSFIDNHLVKAVTNPLKVLLKHMLAHDRIEPVNVDAIALLLSRYSIGAALLDRTPMQITPEEWQSGLNLAFSLIKEKKGDHRSNMDDKKAVRYRAEAGNALSEDNGEYHTYGIWVEEKAPAGWEVREKLHDITTDCQKASGLAELFTVHQLAVIHFRDAVENVLPL